MKKKNSAKNIELVHFFTEFAGTVWNVLFGAYMVINCSSLPSDNDILLLPFFGGNYPIFLLCIIN